MKDERFDGLVRRIAPTGETRTSRRGLLRAAGIGGAAITGVWSGNRVRQATAQEATPVPAVLPAREPGAPNQGQLAADLLYDPEEIFRFVRDEVLYDPYAGVLRGATGTLWGLAGNSADQAVLLAAILNEALVETRFAVGETDDVAAERLLQAATSSRTTRFRTPRRIWPSRSMDITMRARDSVSIACRRSVVATSPMPRTLRR
jgi:hypothetical protein